MLLDAYLLYRMFDTRIFPATGTWPPGVAAAEAIKAGDVGGRKAALLGLGILVGMFGSWFKIPMSAFGRSPESTSADITCRTGSWSARG